jgi:hypothetical protein
MNQRQTRELVLQALLMALWQHEGRSPVILQAASLPVANTSASSRATTWSAL